MAAPDESRLSWQLLKDFNKESSTSMCSNLDGMGCLSCTFDVTGSVAEFRLVVWAELPHASNTSAIKLTEKGVLVRAFRYILPWRGCEGSSRIGQGEQDGRCRDDSEGGV
jgi:hypothetical protein